MMPTARPSLFSHSAWVKSRPRKIFTPIDSKYPGVVAVQSALAPGSGAFGSFDNVDLVDMILRELVKISVRQHRPDADGFDAGKFASALDDIEDFAARIGRLLFHQSEIHFCHQIAGGDKSRIQSCRFHCAAEK